MPAEGSMKAEAEVKSAGADARGSDGANGSGSGGGGGGALMHPSVRAHQAALAAAAAAQQAQAQGARGHSNSMFPSPRRASHESASPDSLLHHSTADGSITSAANSIMALQQDAHAHARQRSHLQQQQQQQQQQNGMTPIPTSLAQAGLYHSEHSEHSSTFKQNAASASSTANGGSKSSTKMANAGSNHRQTSVAASSPARTANGDTAPSGSNASKKNGKSQQTIADELAEAIGAKKDRKRKRVHYSCAECHRRKHKCDRKIPCKPCVDRGIGDECRPFEEGDQHGDVRDRVTRLEDIVEGLALAQTTLAKELALQGFVGTSSTAIGGLAGLAADVNARRANGKGGMSRRDSRMGGASADGGADDDDDEEENEDEGEGGEGDSAAGGDQQRAAKRMRTGKIGDKSDPDAHELEIERRTLDGQFANDGESWFGALALPSVSRGVIETEINGERLELHARMPRYPASHKLNRLIYEGGAPPTILEELMSGLPPRAETDALLELYFRDINYTRLPIHEADFRQSYDDLMEFRWGDAEERLGDDGARHLPFLSLLYSILAIAKQANPEGSEDMESAKAGATRLYHLCRKCTLVASVIRVDHIDLVLTHLFTARFLTVHRQSAEAWSQLGTTIRAAQAIGLHRDGSKLGMDAVTTERRRRIWALIFWMDKTTSILLGRPQAIQEMHCDTLPPSDIDIDTMPRAVKPHPPKPPCQDPSAPPGIYAYIAIRHELAKLTGRIVEHFQNLSSPRKYSDCMQLDEDLEKFAQRWPGPYRSEAMGGADRRFDQACPWLALHRYLLNIEYHYVRIALHRPYVLRNSDKYSQSRKAAFQSAKMDRLIRQEYKRDVKWPSNRARKVHMGGLYRLFNATMMIGISLLLDPNSPEAPEQMAYLDEFIEQHKASDFPDFCSKREVKIIELFRAKAKDPSWCAATATGARKKADAQKEARSATTGKIGPPVSSVRSSAAAAGVDFNEGSPLHALAGGANMTTPPEGSTTSSHDNNDLAQSIFDQLGNLEAYGLYKNTGNADGTLTQPMTLDMTGGLDEFIDFWGDAAGGAGAGTGAANSAPGAAPMDISNNKYGIGMTPSSSQLGGFGATPLTGASADPYTMSPSRSLAASPNSAPGRAAAAATASGKSGLNSLGKGAMSVSFAPNITSVASLAPPTPSSASDSTLIPWGGLIEAIAPLNPNTAVTTGGEAAASSIGGQQARKR